jgi:hypothetical protein
MCDTITLTDKTEAIGYKVVLTDMHGHHYSPFTGIRYKPGRVATWNTRVFLKYRVKKDICWNDTHSKLNLTAVFQSFKTAEDIAGSLIQWYLLPIGFKRSIVKIKLTGKIYTGWMGQRQCFLGNYIESVKSDKRYDCQTRNM